MLMVMLRETLAEKYEEKNETYAKQMVHFVVHQLPGTEEQLNDRIREVADKINKYGSQTPMGKDGLFI